jgi:uncharacterized membrane protein (UPF0127 family)
MKFLFPIVCSWLLPATGVFAANITPPQFGSTTLSAGIHVIHAQVAQTDEQRQFGLMYRKKLAPNEGMLFVFPASAEVCMWMKNTPLPLSVAFLDENGRIVNIEDMEPHTTNPHCAKKPIRFALEMKRGWFKQKNLKPGSSINKLPE